MKKTVYLALATLAFGCSSVKSDFSYQRGKDRFWQGQYNEAIVELHQAIELDPSSSRNHQLLAVTYERLGKLPKAWEHARRAYALDRRSKPAYDIFSTVFKELAEQLGIEKRRPSAKSITDTLGTADKYLHDEKGELRALYYGPICLHIEDEVVVSTEWLPIETR